MATKYDHLQLEMMQVRETNDMQTKELNETIVQLQAKIIVRGTRQKKKQITR